MKKTTTFSLLICFMGIFLFSSCGINKNEMEDSIKQSFQEKMDSDPYFKKYGMKVQKVVLIKTGSNSYDGLVTVLLKEESYNIRISVKTDSSAYMWETEPSAFTFLIR